MHKRPLILLHGWLAGPLQYAFYRWLSGPLAGENPWLVAHPTDDPMALGGVLNRADRPQLRIDVTQHQLHVLTLALEHAYPRASRAGEGAR